MPASVFPWAHENSGSTIARPPSSVHVTRARFTREADMLGAIARHAANAWLRSGETWAVLLEQQGVSRIPDVVLARIDVAALLARVDGGWARPLGRTEVWALRVLRRDRPTRLATVASRLSVGRDHARRILRGLVAGGFVAALGDGFSRLAPARPMVTRFVSFEAKLSDWREALSQACAHQIFAHETWVVFDAAFSTRFDRVGRTFIDSGVGLFALDAASLAVERFLEPPRRTSRPNALDVAVVAERVLGRLLSRPASALPQTRLPGASAQIADPAPPRLFGQRAKTLERQLLAAAGV